MSDLTPIAGKLGSLIRMLASNQPGEVVATASAIGRLLKGQKADFHALAETLTADRAPAVISDADMKKLYNAGYNAGVEEGMKRGWEQAQTNGFHATNTGDPDWEAIIRYCFQRVSRCHGDRERDFVGDMVRRHVREPSEKQAKWLRDIYFRMGGDGNSVGLD